MLRKLNDEVIIQIEHISTLRLNLQLEDNGSFGIKSPAINAIEISFLGQPEVRYGFNSVESAKKEFAILSRMLLDVDAGRGNSEAMGCV